VVDADGGTPQRRAQIASDRGEQLWPGRVIGNDGSHINRWLSKVARSHIRTL